VKRTAALVRAYPVATVLGLATCAPALYAAYELLQALT
jgi:hypothetical protein